MRALSGALDHPPTNAPACMHAHVHAGKKLLDGKIVSGERPSVLVLVAIRRYVAIIIWPCMATPPVKVR